MSDADDIKEEEKAKVDKAILGSFLKKGENFIR